MRFVTAAALRWRGQGLLADMLVRAGIRRVLRRYLDDRHADAGPGGAGQGIPPAFMAPGGGEVAARAVRLPRLPDAFFEAVLGPGRVSTCCHWPEGPATLELAEVVALDACCERAGLAHAQHVLDLGCGWGSLSLFMAEKYPGSLITAVADSAEQGDYLRAEAGRRGLANLTVDVADLDRFRPGRLFDRIVSIERFERADDWPVLFGRIAGWLAPGGRFFLQAAERHALPAPPNDMPASALVARRRWCLDGTHYRRTVEAWLANLDLHQAQLQPVLAQACGADAAGRHQRWRLYFMELAEMFGCNQGGAWCVNQYLFEKAAEGSPAPD